MQRSVLRGGIAGFSVASVLALSACGGPGSGADNGIKGESVAQIQAQVKAAVAKNKSFEASGSGKMSGTSVTNIDLKMDTASKSMMMHATLSPAGTMDIVAVDGHIYMTFDKAAAQAFAGSQGAPSQVIDEIAGKCIDYGATSSGTNPLSGSAADLTSGDPFSGATDWQKGTPKPVNGQEVLPLTSASQHSELDVYTHGDALPARLVSSGSDNSGTFTFTQWGSGISVTKPSGCESLESLMGGLGQSNSGVPTDTGNSTPTDTPSDSSGMPTDTPAY